MHLEILTPEKKVFEGDVTLVTFPGADGSFQVLDHMRPHQSAEEGVVGIQAQDAAKAYPSPAA